MDFIKEALIQKLQEMQELLMADAPAEGEVMGDVADEEHAEQAGQGEKAPSLDIGSMLGSGGDSFDKKAKAYNDKKKK